MMRGAVSRCCVLTAVAATQLCPLLSATSGLHAPKGKPHAIAPVQRSTASGSCMRAGPAPAIGPHPCHQELHAAKSGANHAQAPATRSRTESRQCRAARQASAGCMQKLHGQATRKCARGNHTQPCPAKATRSNPRRKHTPSCQRNAERHAGAHCVQAKHGNITHSCSHEKPRANRPSDSYARPRQVKTHTAAPCKAARGATARCMLAALGHCTRNCARRSHIQTNYGGAHANATQRHSKTNW